MQYSNALQLPARYPEPLGGQDDCRSNECGLLKGLGMFRLLSACQQPHGRGKYWSLLSTDGEQKYREGK